ncbi:MAG: hypothetical protein E7673_06935 [Ruminococcaceae bacterium]|nr:hypothetical protein [Oscillospiraceae bacterium]
MKKLLHFNVFCLLISVIILFTACKKNKDGDSSPSDIPEKSKYTITWVDENGNTVSTVQVEEGSTPSYNYTKSDTDEWDYTFVGWSASVDGEVLTEIPKATQNSTYYAKVNAVKQRYTVTFNSMGGSAIPSQTVEYGAKVTAPENPNYEGHKFIAWSASSTEAISVDFDLPITGNVEYFAVWNETINIKGMLSALLGGYKLNPYSYIPESMRADFSSNLVNSSDIITDYSTAQNVSDIRYGFGEQWHMVLFNLEQTKAFFNVLSVVETLSAASITAFNNYFDSNPQDTAHHEFVNGIYNVTIDFNGEILYYVLEYTANIPVFGNQTIQIALAMSEETGEKNVRIQAGDANVLTYTILENSYTFAIKYLGVRRAMFAITKDSDGNVSGSIYEYLTVSSAEMASAADFYITEDYVSVVGNKADGMVGFTGYINELYGVDDGRLIGYEVQETLGKLVYNTLWFNLDDIAGITSIRHTLVDEKDIFFVNGSSDKWEAKSVGGIGGKMLSRRFDIEFRIQYVYSYDAVEGKYVENEIKVPMIFVQEENFDTFADDIKATNDITIAVNVSSADIDKILKDYDELIPEFIENKEAVTPDVIVEYIGNKIMF